MRLPTLYLLLPALIVCACGNDSVTSTGDELPKLTVVDSTRGLGFDSYGSRLESIVDVSAGVTVLASGFDWSEGPVWVPQLNALLFTDVPQNIVHRWRAPGKGIAGPLPQEQVQMVGVDTFLYPSGYFANPAIGGEPGANGLLLDDQGRLLLCQHGERQVVRFEVPLEEVSAQGSAFAKTSFTPLATHYEGKKLNSPNDLVMLPDGSILFTDPTYGVDKTFGEEQRELDFAGVYRTNPADTAAPMLLFDGYERPNGIALFRGADSFIVSSSEPGRLEWTVCPVASQGPLEEGQCRLFYDATPLSAKPENAGNCDGLVVLPSGHVLASGPGGVLVFDRAGQLFGTIRTGRPTSNVTVGGRDGRDIFITADNLLLQARLQKSI